MVEWKCRGHRGEDGRSTSGPLWRHSLHEEECITVVTVFLAGVYIHMYVCVYLYTSIYIYELSTYIYVSMYVCMSVGR